MPGPYRAKKKRERESQICMFHESRSEITIGKKERGERKLGKLFLREDWLMQLKAGQ